MLLACSCLRPQRQPPPTVYNENKSPHTPSQNDNLIIVPTPISEGPDEASDLFSLPGHTRGNTNLTIASKNTENNEGGGMIDTSGGDPIFATEEQVRILMATLPEELLKIFRRLDVLLNDLDPHNPKAIGPIYPGNFKVLQAFIYGNKYRYENIFTVLSSEQLSFHLQSSACLDGLAEKTASINQQGHICLSLQRLTQLSAESLPKQLLSLVVHEIAHFYDYDEPTSQSVQNMFIEQKIFILDDNIKNTLVQLYQQPDVMINELFLSLADWSTSRQTLCPLLLKVPEVIHDKEIILGDSLFFPSSLNHTLNQLKIFNFIECFSAGINRRSLTPHEYQLVLQDLPSIYLRLRLLKDQVLQLLGEQEMPNSIYSMKKSSYITFLESKNFSNSFIRLKINSATRKMTSCQLLHLGGKDGFMEIAADIVLENKPKFLKLGEIEIKLEEIERQYPSPLTLLSVEVNANSPTASRTLIGMRQDEYTFKTGEHQYQILLIDSLHPSFTYLIKDSSLEPQGELKDKIYVHCELDEKINENSVK